MSDSTLGALNLAPPTHFFASLDGNVLTVAHGDLGNADTSYFYFDLIKAGFNCFCLQMIIEATTVTIEGTNDAPSISNASANWSDVTLEMTAGSKASFTQADSPTYVSVDIAKAWSRLRIKRITSNATNSLKLILTRTKIGS